VVPDGGVEVSPEEAPVSAGIDEDAGRVAVWNVVAVGTAALTFKPEKLVMTAAPDEVLALHADFFVLTGTAVDVLALHADLRVLTGVVELENGADVASPRAVDVFALHADFLVLEMAGASTGAEVTTPAAEDVSSIPAEVVGRLAGMVTESADVTIGSAEADTTADEAGTGTTVAVETAIGAADEAADVATGVEPVPAPQTATSPPGAL
tara:strand:- start:168 stop:794 length:627 start_codon:yes stop_codon:yes gene_type:complete